MNKLISIVVPVYKAEKYINRCIESVVEQTYSNWELLLVNDGSPDNSGELCEVWSRKDSRIRVFHKENGGVSSARNFGIEQAKGDWISFIDSDDWISRNYLEAFVNNLKYGERTIYLQGIQMFTIHKGVTTMFDYENDFYSIIENKDTFVNRKILANGCPVAKLFNIRIIKNNGLRFDETISINEDHLFVLSYYKNIDNICTISNLSYYYYYDFTVPSLTKITHSFTEYHRVSCLIHKEYNSICSKFNFTADEKFVLSPMFGPNQAVKAIQSCLSHDEPLTSFSLCKEYLEKKFGYAFDKYDAEYKLYIKVLSLNSSIKAIYLILKLIFKYKYIKNMIKHRLKVLIWYSHIKQNKL